MHKVMKMILLLPLRAYTCTQNAYKTPQKTYACTQNAYKPPQNAYKCTQSTTYQHFEICFIRKLFITLHRGSFQKRTKNASASLASSPKAHKKKPFLWA